MTLKKALGKVHLWLGLTSGLVVFIVAVTGCIYCFQEEIQDASQEYRFITPQKLPYMKPSELRVIAQEELPGKVLHSLQYGEKDRSVIASFYSEEYYYLVYLHPVSGKVLQVQDMNGSFFQFILDGHFYLWLPPAIGQPVVATATLVFLVMIVTGLVLWWPKKNNRKQRFKIKWNARWRRKNYDMHAVLGFYACALGLVFAITGLVWGFQWFSQSAYWAFSGGESQQPYEEVLSVSGTKEQAHYKIPVDEIWRRLSYENPKAIVDVHFPETAKGSIEIALNHQRGTYWKTDYRYFDQRTLQEITKKQTYGKLKDANTGDLFMRMNYDIHVGQIWGLPGKILAFCASLIVASLPVTGFLIWWGRKYKSKKGTKSTVRTSKLVTS
jgi:uncharacterized iron-regulated membrane protein